ncbi:MAG: Smr/MutS family protein [Gammaproteobacteria bacterium]
MADRKKPSQEDIELFRRSAAVTRPLGSDRIAPFRKRLSTRPRRQPDFEDAAVETGFSDRFDAGTVGAADSLFFARSGVQQRQLQRLRRGQLPIGAELDMHGMTTVVARNAIAHFINRCRDQHIRCIRIIHGKGYSSGGDAPILKNRLNSWLRQHHDVLAFSSTPDRDGGTGAVYVLLRAH